MYYVYVSESVARPLQLYVGYSTNLKQRLEQHNSGRTRSTKPYAPWKIIFYEAYVLASDAKRREEYLKTTKGRKAIKLMLADYFESWSPRPDEVSVVGG